MNKVILRVLEKKSLNLSKKDLALLLSKNHLLSLDFLPLTSLINTKEFIIQPDLAEKSYIEIKASGVFFKKTINEKEITTFYQKDDKYQILSIKITNSKDEEKLLVNFSTISDDNFKKYHGYYLMAESCKVSLEKTLVRLAKEELESSLKEDENRNDLSSQLVADHLVQHLDSKEEKDKVKKLYQKLQESEKKLNSLKK